MSKEFVSHDWSEVPLPLLIMTNFQLIVNNGLQQVWNEYLETKRNGIKLERSNNISEYTTAIKQTWGKSITEDLIEYT